LERLKTELLCTDEEVLVCLGGGTVEDGVEKSNRSLNPELDAGCATGSGEPLGTKSKVSSPFEELNVREGGAGGGGAAIWAGFTSKKLPPFRVDDGDITCAGVDLWLDTFPRPANAAGFEFWDCTGGDI